VEALLALWEWLSVHEMAHQSVQEWDHLSVGLLQLLAQLWWLVLMMVSQWWAQLWAHVWVWKLAHQSGLKWVYSWVRWLES
jgi:hypothetical protein